MRIFYSCFERVRIVRLALKAVRQILLKNLIPIVLKCKQYFDQHLESTTNSVYLKHYENLLLK